ncbi:MAG: cell division protein FtsH, partial [Actinomycetota bacterium]|nr:cell division protein FtsH [Actinomycetota bacterium]
MSRFFRSALFPLILIVLLVWLASHTLLPNRDEHKKIAYSELINRVEADPELVDNLVFNPKSRSIEAEIGNQKVKTNYPSDESQAAFQETLEAKGVAFDSKGTGESAWWSFLTYLLPFILFFGFWIFLMNQVQGGGSKVMSFGKSRAKRMAPDSPKITFKDVAGVDEAVEELQEIKEFLENPKKFQALGA